MGSDHHGGHGHGCCDALDIHVVQKSDLYQTQKVRCSGKERIGDEVNEVHVDVGNDEELTLILPKKRTTAGPLLIAVCSGKVTVKDPHDHDHDHDHDHH